MNKGFHIYERDVGVIYAAVNDIVCAESAREVEYFGSGMTALN